MSLVMEDIKDAKLNSGLRSNAEIVESNQQSPASPCITSY